MSRKTNGSGRKRRPLTPEQMKHRERKAYEKGLRTLFDKMGFARVPSDGREFKFLTRTGELDDIFIFKNIVVIAEYYCGKSDSGHLLKKKPLYDLIRNNKDEFLGFCRVKFPDLVAAYEHDYPDDSIRIKIVYCSKNPVSQELIDVCDDVSFLHGSVEKYFRALIGSIERSALMEFMKFLRLDYCEVGDAALRPFREPRTYQGFLLPEGNSSYPPGYKIVSFYADPQSLLEKSYVLRRDGWRDGDHLYQRVLVGKKIRKMRSYLCEEGRVYVNNVIATLPKETAINDLAKSHRNVSADELKSVRPVSLQIPDGFDLVGIIDGQHRIFCYHEGTDAAEARIKRLRQLQTLLVTGIVYPEEVSELDRRAFEAKLFLEINDNQTRVKPALTQDIELILRPHSSTAIAKRVILGLSRKGVFRGMLQTNFFDDTSKIKTASIVSYGLKPIVKLQGVDSLHSIWPERARLSASLSGDRELLEDYIDFCIARLSEFFTAAKAHHRGGAWDLEAKDKSPLLSPTAINGLIVCLRKVIAGGKFGDGQSYLESLKNVSSVNFNMYKSSQWQKLGEEIFQSCFPEEQPVA